MKRKSSILQQICIFYVFKDIMDNKEMTQTVQDEITSLKEKDLIAEDTTEGKTKTRNFCVNC